MALSSTLISQFVKATNDNTKEKKETTVCGTVRWSNGNKYVQIDGSDLLTPMSSLVNAKEGDRVKLTIKDHRLTATGNITDPSSSHQWVENVMNDETYDGSPSIGEGEGGLMGDAPEPILLSQLPQKVRDLVNGTLQVNWLHTEGLEVQEGTILDLFANVIKVNELTVNNADITKLKAKIADFEEVNADLIDAETGKIKNFSSTYANIDFSNIDKAAMEYFYSVSGLVESVTIGDGTITGRLVGVTISGDLIEGNTIKAEKLVIKGTDGLYYKLNTDGMTTEAEQTDENSINGQVIMAKSITASKVSVDDLVAFDATIGGFTITDNSIFSEVKDSEDNVTRGIYMDSDGQINFGDESNYIKYYRDDNGEYKLIVSASSILYALNGKQYSLSDLGSIGEYVHISTYEDEPCIELGEHDSDFKLIITNTRIMFMEGTTVPAYINNQSLHITKAVIEEETQQGDFVWKVRKNGNMGLIWKGI